jgi:hypothetical protein
MGIFVWATDSEINAKVRSVNSLSLPTLNISDVASPDEVGTE